MLVTQCTRDMLKFRRNSKPNEKLKAMWQLYVENGGLEIMVKKAAENYQNLISAMENAKKTSS